VQLDSSGPSCAAQRRGQSRSPGASSGGEVELGDALALVAFLDKRGTPGAVEVSREGGTTVKIVFDEAES